MTEPQNKEEVRPGANGTDLKETAKSSNSSVLDVKASRDAGDFFGEKQGNYNRFSIRDRQRDALNHAFDLEKRAFDYLTARAYGATTMTDKHVLIDIDPKDAREVLGDKWRSRGLGKLVKSGAIEMDGDSRVKISTDILVALVVDHQGQFLFSNRKYGYGVRNDKDAKTWLMTRRAKGMGDELFVSLMMQSWAYRVPEEVDAITGEVIKPRRFVGAIKAEHWARAGFKKGKDGRFDKVREVVRKFAAEGIASGHPGAFELEDSSEVDEQIPQPVHTNDAKRATDWRWADAMFATAFAIARPVSAVPEAPPVPVVAPEVDDETTTPEADYIPTDEPAEAQADDDTTGQPKAVLSDDADAVPASEPNTNPEPKEAVITEEYTASVIREKDERGSVVHTITGSGDWRKPAPVNRGVVETPPRAVVFPSDAPDWDERVAALNARTARELAEGKIIADAVRQAFHGDRFIPAT